MKSHILAVTIAAASLTGCAGHSFPLSNRFVYPSDAIDTAEIFADTNGTLYPAGWQSHFHPRLNKKRPGEGRWLAGNLLNQSAYSRKFRGLIELDEVRQQGEIKSFAARHKRIFILVHGYNASVEETNIPFSEVESRLDLKPGDGVLHFYWDGLIGKGVGAVKVWFKAANASQLVGSRALRAVLNQIEAREVFVIAHSRGASVVMSALGNPVYDAKFLGKISRSAQGWGKSYRKIATPKPLIDRGNSIHIMLLAPAIDRIDFCDVSQQPIKSKGFVCSKFRPLGAQVKSFDYTVNSSDPVLGKFLFSSQAFNPTGLGYEVKIGRELKAQNYPLFREYVFEKPEGFHGFKDYAMHPVFLQMLQNLGIGKTPMPAPVEPSALP
jgi:Alpha/beta hydrolase of unknown function (DUF900)